MTTHTLETRIAEVPIFTTLRLRVLNSGEGTASLIAEYDRSLDGAFDSFHGGILTTLADTAAWVAVLTLTGADAVIATTDMNIRFLAPCRTNAKADAKVIKFGRTLCPISVDIHDARGAKVAVAQVTYMRLESSQVSNRQ